MAIPEILDEAASLRQERRSMWDQERRYIARINELEARANKIEKACINVVDLLEGLPCQFFACDGPDAPFVSMATCKRCESIQLLRKALGDSAQSSEEGGDEAAKSQ